MLFAPESRRKSLTLSAHALLLLLLVPGAASAQDTIFVPGEVSTLGAALNQVADGGVIELAAGTYNPPAGGWEVTELAKSYTIRGEAGSTVTLDGAGQPIFKIVNADSSNTASIVFENLIFRGGSSTTDVVAGGVTLTRAHATFVDCEFRDNESLADNSGGGGVALFLGSTAHFYDCVFDGNRAKNEGGALKVGLDSRASVHRSLFIGNRTNVADHRRSAAGAAIHVGNGFLAVANSRFVANQGGCISGAIYAVGAFTATPSIPSAEVMIANSTFIDNEVSPHPSTSCLSTVGGALHAENQSRARVYNSRFLLNRAGSGGAVSMFRSTVEIYDSVFRGNTSDSAIGSGYGGTLSTSSLDSSGDAENYPSASLTVRDSLIQGRFGVIGSTALRGGCIWALGDTNRSYGRNGVTQIGGPAQNRATIDVARSVFYDCDAETDGAVNTGVGGAMQLSHVDLTIRDSLFIDNDAIGANRGRGGAIRVLNESDVNIYDTTFANNTAAVESAALHVSGSALDVRDSYFFENTAFGTGNVGVAMTVSAANNGIGTNDFDATGEVRGSVFSHNTAPNANNGGVAIRDFDDDDCTNPDAAINRTVYNQNQFFEAGDSLVYFNSITSPANNTVAQLNGLTVSRDPGCPTTDKATIGNTDLASAPRLGAIVAVPPAILPVTAEGDPDPSTDSYVGLAWSGGSATFNGAPLSGNTDLADMVSSGQQTLVVGSTSYVDSIVNGPTPAATFIADPPSITEGESTDLQWASTAGTFLDASIDRAADTGMVTPLVAGSVTVSPDATTTYRLCLVTEEGGATREVTVAVGGGIFADGFESGDTSAWN